MHWNSVCVLLMACFCAVVVVEGAVTMEVELLNDAKDPCFKYVSKGLDYLRITHARILAMDADSKIIANQMCQFKLKKTEKDKLSVKCSGAAANDGKVNRYNIVFAVTAEKPMMLSQIEYRYNEKVMRLFKNGYLAPDLLAKQTFQHDQHIQIKQITVKGLSGDEKPPLQLNFTSCHEPNEWPSSLFTDHGLYTRVASKKEDVMKKSSWHRMYFDPDSVGEKVLLS